MESLTDALERARAATADALAGEAGGPRSSATRGSCGIVLIALGELAPQDDFTLRLHEAQPLLVEHPAIA